jgi:hypothetical protein
MVNVSSLTAATGPKRFVSDSSSTAATSSPQFLSRQGFAISLEVLQASPPTSPPRELSTRSARRLKTSQGVVKSSSQIRRRKAFTKVNGDEDTMEN